MPTVLSLPGNGSAAMPGTARPRSGVTLTAMQQSSGWSGSRIREAVPPARPLWRSDVHPQVLPVERGTGTRREYEFDVRRLRLIATLVAGERGEHLLLSDGLRAVRLDGPPRTFSSGPACVRYQLEGMTAAEPRLLTLRRLLALCRRGRFSRSLHAREYRARRWIPTLRAWDGLRAGADQREIA